MQYGDEPPGTYDQGSIIQSVLVKVFGPESLGHITMSEYSERHKLVEKVIRRMIHKDGSILVMSPPDVKADERLLQLNPSQVIRRNLLRRVAPVSPPNAATMSKNNSSVIEYQQQPQQQASGPQGRYAPRHNASRAQTAPDDRRKSRQQQAQPRDELRAGAWNERSFHDAPAAAQYYAPSGSPPTTTTGGGGGGGSGDVARSTSLVRARSAGSNNTSSALGGQSGTGPAYAIHSANEWMASEAAAPGQSEQNESSAVAAGERYDGGRADSSVQQSDAVVGNSGGVEDGSDVPAADFMMSVADRLAAQQRAQEEAVRLRLQKSRPTESP